MKSPDLPSITASVVISLPSGFNFEKMLAIEFIAVAASPIDI